jgi:manganese efflux pump family protein
LSIIALITWITAAGGGLYLVSIWLIEYDKDFQAVAATRLPPVVLASHVTLAGGGLLVWVAYLVVDAENLAWISVLTLVLAATLGIFMALRWVGVYRESKAMKLQAAVDGRTIGLGPPERNFPLPVVIGHGLFAVTTIALVLLTALGVGGS